VLLLGLSTGHKAGLAVAVFVFWRQQRLWLREIAALLLFGLVLSGIALIGQVYQLQSAPWRALVLWLALCTPFLALTAQTRLTGTIWAIAAVTTWVVAGDPIHDLLARIAVLPARQRQAVVARHVLGLSSNEAGAVLGLRPDAFRALLHRAMDAMRSSVQLIEEAG